MTWPYDDFPLTLAFVFRVLGTKQKSAAASRQPSRSR